MNNFVDGVLYRVRHFNKATRQFDGAEDTILLPQVVPDENGLPASSNKDIEQSPCNADGWYIYGAKNHLGQFVVHLNGVKRSPLDALINQLQTMMARYRIGDDTGSTGVVRSLMTV
jgi:predicted Abi (CAAX) family protease